LDASIIMPPSASDKVTALLKNASGPGDVFRALTHDPLLATGIVVFLALLYLFGRIYLWPQTNPFKVQWVSDLWDWATSPRPPVTEEEDYPYAKVIYPTYR
jgi:hypothetical protein